ncbi:hypothetical protein Bca4012_033524 [Brassica carinata]
MSNLIGFGTQTYSRVRFLWIACGSRESSLKEAVDGSLGVVVSWCDQLRVLCHTAVVGFWTHYEVKELMKRFIDGETEEGKDVRRRGLRSQ